MTVRIETKTIPAKTIETAVIIIPASEWTSMRWKEAIFGTIAVLSALATMAGFLVFLGVVPIILERDYGFRITEFTDFIKVFIPLVVVFLPTIYGFRKLFAWCENIAPNLKKKHGWDGQSRYRVELEQPQHFPLD